MSAIVNYLLACISFNLIVNNEAARILAMFPTPSISHQVPFRPLTQELAKRGHEVVVITTDPAFPKGQTPPNLTEIDMHDISYEVWRKEFVATATGRKDDMYMQMKVAFDLLAEAFENQIQADEVQNIIQDRSKTFDLLIVEACVRPALALSHIYKVPVIQASSLGPVYGNFKTMGVPMHPLLYPIFTHQRLYNLTWWDKISEAFYRYSLEKLFASQEEIENEMLKKHFGSDIPTLTELANNVHMMFLNIHPIWEGNYPVPPSVIHMGGVHQPPEKQLPQNLKSYLDSSKNGVIYMSFGTNTNPSALPSEKIQMFVRVFSQLPYDVLWKWDKDELPGRSKNIKISKWLPQPDLLRHPKVKLFITQGGLQSTDEAINAGVPLVGVPTSSDQWYNVEKYLRYRIGEKLDFETLSQEQIENAISTVIGDESYRNNVVQLRTLMRDQPMQPLERAVWWTEHVLRHGGAKHLRAPAANMSWREYLELDLIITLLIGLLAVILLFAYIICSFIRFINHPSKKIKVC